MAIAYDSSNSGVEVGVTSKTLSFTATGNNLALVVSVVADQTSDLITGVTANGVSMTKLSTLTPNGGGGDRYSYLFYLANVPAGTWDIIATASSSTAIAITAASYSGVRSGTRDNETSSKQSTSSTTYSPTLTTVDNNCWVVASIAENSAGTYGVGANTAKRVEGFQVIYDSNAPNPPGSRAINATNTNNDSWRSHLVSLAPAQGGGGLLTSLGVG